MSEIAFFDEVAAVGAELMDALVGRDDAAPFLRRTRDVFLLLAEIHDDVVNATVEIGAVRTLEEGRHVLRALHHESLEPVFRARLWCDELQSLGEDLSAPPAGVQIDEMGTWARFTDTLQQREGEVAWMYEEALYQVLSRAESASTLAELQEYMSSVSEQLVTQKAAFDLLAKRAAALARRR